MAESTQRFSGRTLEDAIAKATDALGSGVEIVEAKRVRRGGVFGKLQNETFEVTARARAGARPAARGRGARAERAERTERSVAARASFDHALAELIDEVDLREERQLETSGRELLQSASRRSGAAAASSASAAAPARRRAAGAAPSARPRVANRFSDDDLVPLPPEPEAPRAARVRAASAPSGAAAVMPARDGAAAIAAAAAKVAAAAASSASLATGVLPPPPAGAPEASTIDLREQRSGGPRWSTQALRELGVPEPVLELLPTASLDGDVAWTVALEAAIRARIPLTPTVPLAVHGYGDNAAVQMLQSSLAGYATGDLHLLDRVVPATPFELTLAIRACLSR